MYQIEGGNVLHRKQGQEELVGFVLVVVLVAVAGIILLGLVFRIEGERTETNSAEISQFLESAFLTTTPCHISSPQFPALLGELAAVCADDKKRRCREGTEVCSVLNSSVNGAINSGWAVGTSSVTNGYKFQIILTTNRTRESSGDSILSLQKGTCTGEYRVGEHLQPGMRRGNVLVTTLKLCTGD